MMRYNKPLWMIPHLLSIGAWRISTPRGNIGIAFMEMTEAGTTALPRPEVVTTLGNAAPTLRLAMP